ncbi:hypothetical protein [Loktanella sp. Alg231-35]|uniref:hypothetical protein n=1 Tax=Loktanella sp. Alg231-35 TaxID=1922220 RepID=UPI000D5521F5|nr:hypothetical protein [Loktanella sp. Alg231-35]
MTRGILLLLCLGLAACDVPPPSPQEAADRCEERARAAQGPSVGVTVGANSNTGGFGSASIGVSSDFLRGLDPVAVYESCVLRLTGETPIRPARLRVM